VAFLTVLTRTCNRPRALAANQASLRKQTDPDYEQVLLPDPEAHGVAWANERMRNVGHLIRGEYAMVLDDDDLLTDPALIADLKGIARGMAPDVIVTRMDHGPRGILPGAEDWGGIPARGRIGCSAVIVRADVWRAYAKYYGASYDGDYDFIFALMTDDLRGYRHDKIVSAVGCISRGATELGRSRTMKVRAVISFASMVKGEMQPWPVGRVGELPEGVNWLRLGWVVEESEGRRQEPDTHESVSAGEEQAETKPKRRAKKGE
jgi:hypothetical protein